MAESHKEGIDLLKAQIGQPLQANRFVVEFLTLPKGFEAVNVREHLSILCNSATLPGKSIGTAEHYRHRYMPDGSVDYGESVDFTFICDANFMDRMIIEEWLRMVHSAGVSTRTALQNEDGSTEGQVFSFYSDYAQPCSARIHVLRKDGTSAMIYTLHECYPSDLAAQDLSMDSAEGPLEFSFTLNYRHWSSKYEPMGDVGEFNQPQQGNFELSGLNKGRRVFDAVLEGLKVAGRFNKKAGDLGRRLGSFDTAITRGSNISRDLGVNAKYITNERRGGG